jgi:hypothetical protein
MIEMISSNKDRTKGMHGKLWLASIFWLGVLSILFSCAQKPTAPSNDNPFDPENQVTQGDPFRLQASIANGGITLRWNDLRIAGLAEFIIYRKTETESQWRRLVSQAAGQTTYVDRNISNGHTYSYTITAVDKYGNETARTNVAQVVINTQPVLVVNGDAPYTNSQTVSLTIVAGAATHMLLANSAYFENAAWQPYARNTSWQLLPGDGSKTVYLKIRYQNGDTSGTVYDKIILDSTPPLAVLNIFPDSGITNETEFQFDPMHSRDNISATSQLSMRIDYEGDGIWDSGWSNLDLFLHTFERGGGSKSAVLQVKDLAGNIDDTTVTFYVNTRPVAVFEMRVDDANERLYHFDASASHDAEDGNNVQFRWDWQGDGVWDTPFSAAPKAEHTYSANGTYHPALQVRDSDGLTAIHSETLSLGFPLAFDKTFGGNDFDFGSDVQQTADGGFAVLGYTKSFGSGSYDIYLIKTDEAGNKLWTQTYGGSAADVGYALRITSDGNWIVTGSTQSFGAGKSDVWLLQTDAQGNMLFSKTFGGTDDDEGNAIIQTSDGGFLIVGNTRSFGAGGSDVWLIKTDANGQKIWDRTVGGPQDDLGLAVCEASDGFLLTGATASFGNGGYDLYLCKTDFSGNVLWQKTFGGALDEKGYAIVRQNDGTIAICGSRQSGAPGNVADAWLLKADGNGNLIWQKTYGGNGTDEAYSLLATPQGGFILAGYTDSFGQGNGDMWIVKTDGEGTMLWNKTVGGANFDKGKKVRSARGETYIFTGSTSSRGYGYSDVWLVKSE